jgi:hypothetical protein
VTDNPSLNPGRNARGQMLQTVRQLNVDDELIALAMIYVTKSNGISTTWNVDGTNLIPLIHMMSDKLKAELMTALTAPQEAQDAQSIRPN